MNKLLYLSDGEVQSQLATRYNLFVHIGTENFQYAIIDSMRAETKVLAEYEFPPFATISERVKAIENLAESNAHFKFIYNKVKISFTTTDFTFIPANLYLESNQQDYGKFINLSDHDELVVNELSSLEIKNLVKIDSGLKAALQKIFYKPKIYNQTTPFLEGIYNALHREDERVCLIDVQSNYFQIALFKDFKLEFSNIFEFENVDEFNYYILSVIQSLEIRIEETPVVLSGKIAKSDLIYQRIEKYFEIIRFIDANHSVKYTEKFEEITPHTYFTLFSLDLCE